MSGEVIDVTGRDSPARRPCDDLHQLAQAPGFGPRMFKAQKPPQNANVERRFATHLDWPSQVQADGIQQ